jgi:membrane-associated protein
MNFVNTLINYVLHLAENLAQVTATYGALTYAFLFAIIFAETGLVIFPFLPGDSLLFASGAIAALGSLNIFFLLAILSVAAILGDTVNYWIGHFFGDKILAHPKLPIKPAHIKKTQDFYAKHGGKTIILARFVPIVRTFAPFVAGIGTMDYKTFISYNIVGGIAWVCLFTLAGFFFGNLPMIQKNFHYVILAIIAISVIPMAIEYIKAKRQKTPTENN